MAEYVDVISMGAGFTNTPTQEGGFQAVDPGSYDWEIEKSATGVSQSGNNVLKVTGRVIGPSDSPMLDRVMTNTYVIKPGDPFLDGRLLNFLKASGAQIGSQGEFSRESLIGLRLSADVERRPAKDPGINPATGLPNTEAREFSSWVRERPIGSDQVVAATGSAAPKANTPPANAPRRPVAPGNGARANGR